MGFRHTEVYLTALASLSILLEEQIYEKVKCDLDTSYQGKKQIHRNPIPHRIVLEKQRSWTKQI